MSTALTVLSKKEKQRKKLERRLSLVQKDAAKIIKFKKKHKKEVTTYDEEPRSTFNRRMKSMQRRIDKGEIDNAIVLIQKQLLKTLVDVIPIAEISYRRYKNERASYALSGLISGARELIGDIQATKDSQQLIDRIVIGVMQPAFASIAQQIVSSTQHIYREIEDVIDHKKKDEVKQVLTGSAKDLGHYLNEQLVAVRTRLEKDMGQ